MLLPGGEQGLIDFQDALVGHPAYDLVSLLQDARRDVSPELERSMLDRYLAHVDADAEFEADYARLGAQRNAKIVGIFARLWLRDRKPRYLAMIPRVWDALERDLEHPALAPVAEWFAAKLRPSTQPRYRRAGKSPFPGLNLSYPSVSQSPNRACGGSCERRQRERRPHPCGRRLSNCPLFVRTVCRSCGRTPPSCD